MRRIAAALSIPAAVLVVAACGTSHPPTSSLNATTKSPTPSPSPTIDYGQQYLADVTPMNNAADAFGKAMTNRQNIRAYRRLANTEQVVGTRMLRQKWPSNAESDVQALAEAYLVDAGDNSDVSQDF